MCRFYRVRRIGRKMTKIVLLLFLLMFPVNDIVDTPVAARCFRRVVKNTNSILRNVQLVQYYI